MPESSASPYEGDPARHAAAAAVLVAVMGLVPLIEAAEGAWPGRGVPRTIAAARSGELGRSIESALARGSVVARAVRPYYNEAMLRAFAVPAARVLLGRDHWLFLRSSVNYWQMPERRLRAARAATIIEPSVRWLQRRGINVLLAIVPNKETMYPHMLPPRPRFESAYGELMRELEARRLWLIDLRPALAPRMTPTYLSCDTHWSSPGALRAAEAIAAAVRRRFPLGAPGAEVQGTLRRAPGRPWRGDLLIMMGLRHWSAAERPYLSTEWPITGVDAAGKRIDPRAPQRLVLLGTSFSNCRRLNSMLAVLLQRPVEELTTAGAGPAAGFSTLAGQLQRGERPVPGLVIWEFPERHAFDARLAGALRVAMPGAAPSENAAPGSRGAIAIEE